MADNKTFDTSDCILVRYGKTSIGIVDFGIISDETTGGRGVSPIKMYQKVNKWCDFGDIVLKILKNLLNVAGNFQKLTDFQKTW